MNKKRPGFNPKTRLLMGITVVACFFGLNSCFGFKADIEIREDGSGRLNLEYRSAKNAESPGRLDGNEGRQLLPAGRSDFERSLERLPGMELRSFSLREEGEDLVNRIVLEFADLDSLLAFLDSTGEWALYREEGGKKILSLTLNSGGGAGDPELLDLMKSLFGTYRAELSLSVPGEAVLEVLDSRAAVLSPSESLVSPRGKRVSFSMPVSAVLTAPGGLVLRFSW
jgi:hypothetical protein